MTNRISRLSQTKLPIERTPLEKRSIYARLLGTVIVIAFVVATSFFIYTRVSTEPTGLFTSLLVVASVGIIVGFFAGLASRYQRVTKNSWGILSTLLLALVFGLTAVVVIKLLPMFNVLSVTVLAGLFTLLLTLQLAARQPDMPLIVINQHNEEGGAGAFILLTLLLGALGAFVFLLFLFN